MKNFILLFVVVLISTLFSCKKKDVEPTTPPFPVNTKVVPTFGAYTYGSINIFLGQQVIVNNASINLVGSSYIDMPYSTTGTYSLALYIDSLYHIDFKTGGVDKYGADLTFQADGSYTEVNKTGNLLLKKETYNGSEVLMFRP
jgi:hypothetical protein